MRLMIQTLIEFIELIKIYDFHIVLLINRVEH